MKQKKVLLQELKTGHIFMIDNNYPFWYLVLEIIKEDGTCNYFLCLQENGKIIKREFNKNILLILLNRDKQ